YPQGARNLIFEKGLCSKINRRAPIRQTILPFNLIHCSPSPSAPLAHRDTVACPAVRQKLEAGVLGVSKNGRPIRHSFHRLPRYFASVGPQIAKSEERPQRTELPHQWPCMRYVA